MSFPSTTLFPSAASYPGAGKAFGEIAVGREYPSDDLYVIVEPPKGVPTRWAADEPQIENVIEGLQLTDEMSGGVGGDKEMSGTLNRNPRLPWPDLAAFTELSVRAAGGEGVGSYYLDKAPESDGDHVAITPAAIGHGAMLDDDGAIIGPAFVNRDQSAWTDVSVARREALIKAGVKLDAATATGWQGKGEEPPGVLFDFNGTISESGKSDRGEATFDSGGADIGALLYRFVRLNGGAGSEWFTEARLAANDELTEGVDKGNDHEANSNADEFERLDAQDAHRRYAFLTSSRSESGEGGVQLADLHAWQWPIVLGNHGLDLQGKWPNLGFTAAQMLGYAVPKYTPLKADPEDLEDSGYVIQQAWYSDPGPLSAVIADLCKYELLDAFVFGRDRFQLRFPGTYGRSWLAYAGPSGLSEVGLDSSRLWREIVVSYQDEWGATRTVGPLGSGADVENAGLEITDPDHPAVRAGRTRKDLLSLGTLATPPRAIEAGERFLGEANLLSRSGSATLSGFALDDRGIMRPVSQLRAGDRLRFPDAHDTSWRKVVRRSYDHSSRTVSVDLDAPAEGLQALLERMQAAIQSLQLS